MLNHTLIKNRFCHVSAEPVHDYVTINGFSIYGATQYSTSSGIFLTWNTDHCTISNNRCGWHADYVNKNGISLYGSSYNTISDNACWSASGGYGIYLYNDGSHNTYYNTVSSNTCSNCYHGIKLTRAFYNTISNNNCSSNSEGIYLELSENNTLSSNTCNNNTTSNANGIFIGYSSLNNTISGNTCDSNVHGLRVEGSCNNNTIYLNNFSNNSSYNIQILGATITPNSPTPLYYFYQLSHVNYMGNYYSNYTGSDSDNDGIGESTYNPSYGPNDQYPLITTSDHYSLQAWWLNSDDNMYRDDMTKAPGSITIGPSSPTNIWIADQPALTTINFSGSDTWTGQVAFTSAPASGTIHIKIGYSTDGSDFTAGGPQILNLGDASAEVITYETSASAFTVSKGNFLALEISSGHEEDSYVRTGGAWSYTSSPETSTDYSLPVELTSFTTTAGDCKVTLKWATESEIENLGFNIHRSLFGNRDYRQINGELIFGAGNSSTRHEYEYLEKGLTNGVTYWYKLEDVDYSGNTELHGPVSATPMKKAAPSEFCLYPILSQSLQSNYRYIL